jgi:hypothetical protein
MKKASLLLLIFISLTAFTCENEPLDAGVEEAISTNNPTDPTNPTNPTNPTDPTSIVGIWRAVSFEASVESSITVLGLSTNVTSDTNGSNLDYTVTFTDNNTFATNGSYDVTSTVNVDGEPPATSTQNYDNVMGTGTYELTGANMITVDGAFYNLSVDGIDTSAIADAPQEAQYTISADGLTLTFIQDQQELQNLDGIEISTTILATSIFTRQ